MYTLKRTRYLPITIVGTLGSVNARTDGASGMTLIPPIFTLILSDCEQERMRASLTHSLETHVSVVLTLGTPTLGGFHALRCHSGLLKCQ